MSTFKRQFVIQDIGDDRLITDLLSFWRPAGADAGKDGLRLAIRDKYVNFYRGGQSAAKVSFDRNRQVKARVHGKYVDDKQIDQEYRKFSSHDNINKAQIKGWIAEASTKIGDEKKFVDLLVGSNPNVIDLEMTLPFDNRVNYTREPKKAHTKVAIRVDLVALEKIEEVWTVVFWEAKPAELAMTSEAGSEGKRPKVMTQLDNYTAWVGKNREVVIAQYRSTCELLCRFHSIAAEKSLTIAPLGEGIIAVAKGATLEMDAQPRLVIDNRNNYLSFENIYLKTSRDAKIHVQIVEANGSFVLESRV